LSSPPYYEVVRGGVRMKKKKLGLYIINVLVLVTIMMLSFQNVGLADHHPKHLEEDQAQWQRLNQLAEKSLSLANKQEFEASRKLVSDLSVQFLAVEIGKYVERVDQAHILLETIQQAEESLNSIDPIKGQAEQKVLRMRLALDAVSHKKQPLWLNYYPTMAKALNELRYAIEQNKSDYFYRSINRLSAHFEMVRPSLIISHPQEVVVQLDSQLRYINENKSELWNNKDKMMQMINAVERQMKVAFFQDVENTNQTFLFIIFGIGTLICTVLSYVAWRKYRGETDRKIVVWKKSRKSEIE
jgi:sporulation protein YpjB